jgi:hypothetical protein
VLHGWEHGTGFLIVVAGGVGDVGAKDGKRLVGPCTSAWRHLEAKISSGVMVNVSDGVLLGVKEDGEDPPVAGVGERGV